MSPQLAILLPLMANTLLSIVLAIATPTGASYYFHLTIPRRMPMIVVAKHPIAIVVCMCSTRTHSTIHSLFPHVGLWLMLSVSELLVCFICTNYIHCMIYSP